MFQYFQHNIYHKYDIFYLNLWAYNKAISKIRSVVQSEISSRQTAVKRDTFFRSDGWSALYNNYVYVPTKHAEARFNIYNKNVDVK